MQFSVNVSVSVSPSDSVSVSISVSVSPSVSVSVSVSVQYQCQCQCQCQCQTSRNQAIVYKCTAAGKKRPVQQLQRLQPLKRGQYSNYSDYSHYSEGKSHLRQIIYLRQSESGQCTASVACLRASVATYKCTAAEKEVITAITAITVKERATCDRLSIWDSLNQVRALRNW